jgi:hypothetical protein
MRRLISVGLVVALLLAAVPVALGLLQGLSRSHGAAASSSLTCSVKASCDSGSGEVALFRMSGQANGHAQTAETHPKIYDWTVCCSWPTGLGTSCSGNFDAVLWLSAADNAHAAQASQTGYATQVCLSAASGTVDCKYVTDSSCGTGYVCLATIFSTTNAHVADCDGSNDYGTKVCCAAAELATPTATATATPMGTPTATPTPAAVGGIAELPHIAGASAEEAGAPAEGSGWSAGRYAALAAGLAAAFAIAFGGWYARRRWLR